MKMNCLIIIGIILALLGISLILKAVFFISIPILKILLGLFLILTFLTPQIFFLYSFVLILI